MARSGFTDMLATLDVTLHRIESLVHREYVQRHVENMNDYRDGKIPTAREYNAVRYLYEKYCGQGNSAYVTRYEQQLLAESKQQQT